MDINAYLEYIFLLIYRKQLNEPNLFLEIINDVF